MSLLSELRRRNVFKVAFVYVVAAALLQWLIMVAETQLGLPGWTSHLTLFLLVAGFPGTLMFAWVYEITPRGLRKAVDVDQTQSIVFKTGQKLNAALAVLTVLACVAMIADRLLPDLARPDRTPLQMITKAVTSVTDAELLLDRPTHSRVPGEIRSFTLENGLKVIVWPDADIPNVVIYNFVRAGGRNEYPGITGLSHFFEHMMFNGTENVPPGDFDVLMEAAGGANNAYTSNDVTVYQDWFPRTALDVVFALEGDRFANLAIDPDVVESERGVVFSERRSRIDNDNFGKLFEQMWATAFLAHPYQFPVIGWPSDIEAWTQEDLESFFRTYYAPNNSVMVVTGDVTAEEVYAFTRTYFGDIPAQEPPAEIRTVEPEQLGTRRFAIEAPAQTPLLHAAFHAGDATDPVTLPLTLLLNILVNGNSSRLHQVLVEQEQLAISVGAFQSEGFDPGLAYFYLTLPPGSDVEAVEARFLALLGEAASEGVTEAELDKARNIMLADFWRQMATIDGKASQLGNFEVFHGNYELLFDLPTRIDAVTVADLQQAAAQVFRPANATIGVLLPAAEEPAGASQ
ncbi:MAG: pitrilysin family protein [Woeseiaceae bacterium]|nr:pitrilysin family protein [Woeseiaceae bacterium]